jgi:hypothetical protein
MSRLFVHEGRAWLMALVAPLAIVAQAQAAPIFTIERISDKEAILTATGTLPAACPSLTNCHVLGFGDPFATDPVPTSNDEILSGTSTLAVGGTGLQFAYEAGAGSFPSLFPVAPSFYIGSSIALALPGNAAFSGEMSLALTDATFGPVGASGDVYWGTHETGAIGTWQITGAVVPEPTALSLLGLAISAVAARHWRQRRQVS